MDALAALLTRERLLVELVVFKLTELRQLLLAGETRFLGWAAEEVERASTAVRTAEVERAVLVQSLAETRGLVDDPTLTAIVADSPEPWRTLLADAHTGLRTSTDEVATLLSTVRRLAQAGSRSLADTLSRLDGDEPDALRTPWDPPAQRSRVEQHL
jgi:hypothetical protein